VSIDAVLILALTGSVILALGAVTALNFVAGRREERARARWLKSMEAADEQVARAGGCTHDAAWCCDTCWTAAAP
jgi:hypothetical protein